MSRIIAVTFGVVVVGCLLLGTWIFYGMPRSDPPNDFKRFVMGGPHWSDEDKQFGYNPATVALPKSVRVLKSARFSAMLEEGAVLYFTLDRAEFYHILVTDDFEPTDDPEEKDRLNKWSRRYLWVSSAELGPDSALYITKASRGNVYRTLMATNAQHTRAIFVYDNFN